KTEKRPFLTKSAREKHADGDPVARPMQWDRHRRLTGDVGDRVPRIEREVEPPPGDRSTLRLVKHAERSRSATEGRRNPSVVALEECSDHSRLGRHPGGGLGEFKRRAGPAELHELPCRDLKIV